MPSLRDIRKRIRSVKSTQQITKAMKMVAAAKLRRAQEAVVNARPYALMLDQMISDVAARTESMGHVLMTGRTPRVAELVVLTSDRGLAGGFNSNVLRRAGRFIYEKEKTYEKIQVSTIGRKGNEFFRRRSVPMTKDYSGLYARTSYRAVAEVARELTESF